MADAHPPASPDGEELGSALELKGVNFQFGGRFKGIGIFLQEVQAEFKKISWPKRHQIVVETGVVIAVCTFLTFLVLFYDWIFDGVANRVFYGQ
ncbi:MAG: preprotein translocase subunit SecE [Cyanobacteria bacterium REEB65]|nr:preprotein translocase subunit SecE [Cyanobacteria bacterium REEB65]